ncbi:MAG: phage tail protein [Pseudomonadota bacterium]|nr:phage tail protein [Pseudomonadota bacterium]
MGFLRQGGQSPAYIPRYTGLQIQTSSNTVPITILYGTNRLAPNVIWTGGFYAVAQTQKQGGKGGGGKTSVQGYSYYTSFLTGLCEGPINGYDANSIIARWLQLTNTAAVWSGGKLKFIPYGDSAVTGQTIIGNVTFNPNVTPIYNLADNDFVHEDGKDHWKSFALILMPPIIGSGFKSIQGVMGLIMALFRSTHGIRTR